MEEYCQNPLCENKAIKEVPVSVRTTSDQVRSLCACCDEVYTWGVQHGSTICEGLKIDPPPKEKGDEQLSRSMLLNNSQAQNIARFRPGKALLFTEGYFEALRIRTPNLAEQLRLTPPPTDKELLEAVCEEQWYRSTREKRISDELGQLKEFMDKYDDQRQIVSSRVNASVPD